MEDKIEAITDYYSEPENFGPIMWKFLHLFSLMGYINLPPQKMIELLPAIQNLIPCEDCKDHFFDEVANHPYDDDMYMSPQWGARYFVELHNHVNRRLWKPKVSFEEFIDNLYNEVTKNIT